MTDEDNISQADISWSVLLFSTGTKVAHLGVGGAKPKEGNQTNQVLLIPSLKAL